MSWEKSGESRVACPCGCGSVYQEHFDDDWNRTKDGPVTIDCEVCSKKYKIESKYFCPKPYHDYTIYYFGNHIHVLGGYYAEIGNDRGELIISDAEVLLAVEK